MIELLEIAASALGPLTREVGFLGGATIELWITDPAAQAPRPTEDVDVIVEIGNYGEYAAFGDRLRMQGFSEDSESQVICRWRHRDRGSLVLDVMPTSEEILGFSNRWYSAALASVEERELPSRATIRAVPPVHLLATKIEAFHGRGKGDFLASHDFEDIVLLINGRPELLGEIDATHSAWPEMIAFIVQAVGDMREDAYFSTAVHGVLAMRDPGRGRLIEERLAAIADIDV